MAYTNMSSYDTPPLPLRTNTWSRKKLRSDNRVGIHFLGRKNTDSIILLEQTTYGFKRLGPARESEFIGKYFAGDRRHQLHHPILWEFRKLKNEKFKRKN